MISLTTVQRVCLPVGEQLGKRHLRQIGAQYDHGQRSVHGSDRPDHSGERRRQLHRQEKQDHADYKSDQDRIRSQLLQADNAPILCHDQNTVGPLQDIQDRHKGSHEHPQKCICRT